MNPETLNTPFGGSEEESVSSPEKAEGLQKSESILARNFWKEIQTGERQTASRQDIEFMIDTVYLSRESITLLSERQESLIRTRLISKLEPRANADRDSLAISEDLVLLDLGEEGALDTILSNPDYKGLETILKTENSFDGVFLFDKETVKRKMQSEFSEGRQLRPYALLWHIFKERHVASPTKDERVRFFSNPDVWKILGVQGYRPLIAEGYSDSYGFEQPSDFLQLLERVRQRVGKKKLRMLDVGGGLGEALYEAKKLDSDLETYNICVDEEPAMYPVDHLILSPAEKMPKNLEGSMDIIVSNISFKYYLYPGTALLNVAKALSVGGEAIIDFSPFQQHPLGEEECITAEEYEKDMKASFEILKSLHEEGRIKIRSTESTDGNKFTYKDFLQGAKVYIEKLSA